MVQNRKKVVSQARVLSKRIKKVFDSDYMELGRSKNRLERMDSLQVSQTCK